MVESEHLDVGFGRVEYAVMLVRAGHLALQAAGTLPGIDVEGFEHGSSDCVVFFVPPDTALLNRAESLCSRM